MTQYIKTVLDVDASKAVAGFAQGEKAIDGYAAKVKTVGSDAERAATQGGAGLARLTGSIRENRAAWDDLSTKAMIGGAALAGGLGLAGKAAIDWESQWAGVEKTVDGTDAQMAKLEGGLRNLAKELPATHEEIAGVAEAAGQLGVARKDILGFTETAIALGESTNLSAEEAATSLAKFSNIMGTAAREGVVGYEKLGSTLVELGNNGASTERDIMSMALRLAGAGKQIGASESDILAMANALSSVGIEAELGGGAMSRALLEMNTAVIGGGDELEKFAQISGMSAQEFAAKWRSDPIAATNDFVGGLGRIGASGGDASAALDSVGLSGTQNAQVLLRAAGSSDLMTESLKQGSAEWKVHSALAEEAGKRYATSESQLAIARNQIKDAAIDLGGALAPAAVKVAQTVGGMANAFSSLPGPVQSTITGVAGVTSGLLLLGGATVKAVGWAQDMQRTLKDVGMLTPRVEKGLKGAATGAKLLGQALAITAAVGTVGSLLQDKGDSAGVAQLTKDLLDADDAVSIFNDSISSNAADLGMIQGDVTSFGDALKIALDPGWMDNVTGGADSLFKALSFGAADMQTSVDESSKVLGDLDNVLTGLVSSGRQDLAEQMFGQFASKASDLGYSADELKGKLPGYTEALASAGNEAKLAGDGASQMGGDLAGLTGEAEGTEEAVDDLVDTIESLGDSFLDEREAARAYQEALQEMRESLRENGSAYGLSTKAGRANMESLEGIAKAARDSAAATFEQTGSVEKAEAILAKGRRDVDRYAGSLDGASGDARRLKDNVLQLPAEAKTEFKAVGAEAAVGNAAQFGLALGGIPPKKDVKISEYGSTDSAGRVDILNKMIGAVPLVKTAKVTETGATHSAVRVNNMSTKIRDLKGKTVSVLEAGATASRDRVVKMDGAIFGLKGKQVSVTEIGSTASGARVVRFKGEIYTLNGKTVSVGANVFGGAEVGALVGQINQVQDKTATVTVNRVTNTISRVFGGNADGGMHEGSGAGLVQSFADGGHWDGSFRTARPQIRPAGGRGVNWAEEGAGPWEAFISGHPGKKARSLAILDQVAARLGRATMPLDGIQSFASGGVYGTWRKWLLEAQRMSRENKYRFEDGSRMIRVFEDGSAQWRGYSAPTAEARRVIARLNAAQERYEDALNARDRQRSATKSAPKRYTGQHSAEYNRKQAEWKRIRRQRANKAQYTGQHSDYYNRKQAEWRRIREEKAAPKSWAGHAFQRMPVSQHAGRTYVAPQFRTVASGGASTVTQVDSRAIGAAVASAVGSEIRQLRVVTTINGRDFQGTLQKTARDRKGR